MSLLDELNRNDQIKALISAINVRNVQIKNLVEQRDSLQQEVALLKEEIQKLSAAKKTTTRRRTKTKTVAKQEKVNDDSE